jgi:CheY-like chemotaxis protein
VQALQVFESHHVDLVLLDYAMPGMNGGEVAQGIKQSRPNVPVVLMSGTQVPDAALTWVDSFLPKGQGPESLLSTIDRLLLLAA